MPVDLEELKILVGSGSNETVLPLFAKMGENAYNTILSEQEYNDLLRDMIMLNLAGHYYVVSQDKGGIVKMRVGTESEDQYRQPASDKVGFMGTRFGQDAVVLDASGLLMRASRPAKVKFGVQSV